ncbi:hypothetical protein [Merdimonas faecis]|uniref:hypothetical protein n=1 Tax=Merdimonas faecis TaxID=1653435 RepID=UPI00086364A9|nr:hypothetical protein [Merdimonas faecis]
MLQIIQQIDQFFLTFIAIPLVFVLLCHFRVFHRERPRIHQVYKLCVVLILIFLIRCFLTQFVFTPVNYPRFVDSRYFPLIEALFYSE